MITKYPPILSSEYARADNPNRIVELIIHQTPSNSTKLSLRPVREYHRQKKSLDKVIPLWRDRSESAYQSGQLEFYISIHMLFLQLIRCQLETTNLLFWLLADVKSFLASHLNCNADEKALPTLPSKKRFTRRARAKILDAAGALEKEGYAPESFYFFTGTLPGSTDAACKALACNSRNLVNALKQFLRRLGLYFTFNCWEWQKRERQGLTPALHLHLVVLCEDEDLGARLPDLLKEKWLDLIENTGKLFDVDMYERDARLGGVGFHTRDSQPVQERCCKTIRCEKSPAAYLSKYVGKGSLAGSSSFIEKCHLSSVNLYYPSSWWSISNELRQLIKKHSFNFCLRMRASSAAEVYTQIVDFLRPAFTLELKPFSPEGYPDYLFQNFYIESDLYKEIGQLLGDIFQQLDAVVWDYTGFATLPNIQEAAVNWLHKDSNYKLLEKFEYSLPFYERRGDGVDWQSKYVLQRAANWVKTIFRKKY
jgi:hypothetical protein